jgi:RNA polymerase sigma factor (sigma-70 family)
MPRVNVEDNMGLVTHIVRRYYSSHPESFKDALQLGYLALVKAANSYKQTYGVPFASYAAKCIRNELNNAFRTHNFVSVSLDDEIDSDEHLKIQDVIQDKRINVEAYCVERIMMESALGKLDEITKKVITMRLEGYTYKEIGSAVGVTSSKASKMVYEFANELGLKIKR